MKKLLLPLFIGVLVTLVFYSSSIFLPGIEMFLLPFMMILYLLGISTLILVPVVLYKLIKRQRVNKWIVRLFGLLIGLFIGSFLQQPIDNWFRNQRNVSGQIVAAELEKYKESHGQYPDSLAQLDLDKINDLLLNTYQSGRFRYRSRNNQYDLEISIPFFDWWQWNKEEGKFEYEDW